ncbi:hypothetical protein BDV95DRAFT_484651 [Massariosphaeria phaeospora]|uniref:Uncharacterized protein n=1 Tax=Massariosphaeria phaeospora TaxID=100035 RepID=A0A7C8MKD4_9PLEO|nr:hypothetical protein BDV95DRAFT_484651 [Massariosphaeria phaeospora]
MPSSLVTRPITPLSEPSSRPATSPFTPPRSVCTTNPSTPAESVTSAETSLSFSDETPVFTDDDATTVSFPPRIDMIPSETNGTILNDVVWAIKSPTKTATDFAHSAHRRARSLDWGTLKGKLEDLKDRASYEVGDRLNRAFEGHDAVELGNKVVDLLPSVSLPNSHQIGKAMDSLGDAIQGFMERNPPQSHSEDINAQVTEWQFARSMGGKARRALVSQGICKPFQIVPTQRNSQWQMALNQALATLFHCMQNNPGQLTDMKPLWIGDRRKKVWRLVIDTGCTDLEEVDGDFVETPEYLHTGFELSEACGCISVKDYTRETVGVEEDWELVERC